LLPELTAFALGSGAAWYALCAITDGPLNYVIAVALGLVLACFASGWGWGIIRDDRSAVTLVWNFFRSRWVCGWGAGTILMDVLTIVPVLIALSG